MVTLFDPRTSKPVTHIQCKLFSCAMRACSFFAPPSHSQAFIRCIEGSSWGKHPSDSERKTSSIDKPNKKKKLVDRGQANCWDMYVSCGYPSSFHGALGTLEKHIDAHLILENFRKFDLWRSLVVPEQCSHSCLGMALNAVGHCVRERSKS